MAEAEAGAAVVRASVTSLASCGGRGPRHAGAEPLRRRVCI